MEVTFDGGRMVTLRKKQVLAITGRTVIRRSDFGAHFPDVRDTTVGDEVEVTLSGEFVKD
jgi:polyisoprenoid-binding protein YceI